MKKRVLLITLLLNYICAYSQPYWHPVASGTTKDLLSVSFGSRSTGYIGGKDSLLLKTTNGGQNWQPVTLPPGMFSNTRKDIVSVSFLAADTGYISLAAYPQSIDTRVYKTTDGGATWSWLRMGNAVPLYCLFDADGKGYVVGSTAYKGFAVSRIGNDTVYNQHVFSDDPYLFFRTVDYRNTVGIAAGDEGLIARTFDNGNSWDTVSATGNTGIYAVSFLNDSTVLAASNSPGSTLLVSRDTGHSWTVETNSLTFDYPVMKALVRSPKDSFIAVGASTTTPGKGTLYWHDGVFNSFQNVDFPLQGVAMRDDSIAYAVGAQGFIVTNATTPLSIDNVERLRASWLLYPNPSYGQCISSMPVKHTLKIFDVGGRVVTDLDRSSFSHNVQLKHLAPGIFIIAAETERGTLRTKLVLR
jgi:photosystem II stability/assembly factor-like uncharacterized protein